MKITLTYTEAAEMLRQNFQNSTNTVEVVIAQPKPDVGPFANNQPQLDLMPLVDVVRQVTPRPGAPKINAIKALREVASRQGFHVGLGDAKRFVELFIP